MLRWQLLLMSCPKEFSEWSHRNIGLSCKLGKRFLTVREKAAFERHYRDSFNQIQSPKDGYNFKEDTNAF